MSNVEPLRNDIDKTLKEFVLYGTLGPNGKFIASGAKFNSKNANSRAIALRKKGFSCIVEDDSVVIHMCSKLWVLLKKHSFASVENIGEYKNFFDVIQSNVEWMSKGNPVKLLITSPFHKWDLNYKESHIDFLKEIRQDIQKNCGRYDLGWNLGKAMVLFDNLIIIHEASS